MVKVVRFANMREVRKTRGQPSQQDQGLAKSIRRPSHLYESRFYADTVHGGRM